MNMVAQLLNLDSAIWNWKRICIATKFKSK